MINPTREEIGNILKNSKKIAVVGLSENPYKTSYMVSEAMKVAGYEIYPVNPNATMIMGLKAYSSLRELPTTVDIVNVFRRSEQLLEVAMDFLETDCPVFWAQSGLVNEEAYELLNKNQRTVIMDRCIKVEHAMTK